MEAWDKMPMSLSPALPGCMLFMSEQVVPVLRSLHLPLPTHIMYGAVC